MPRLTNIVRSYIRYSVYAAQRASQGRAVLTWHNWRYLDKHDMVTISDATHDHDDD